jgi:hypothetical protein
MGAAPVIRVVTQREKADCAIVALSMYLGESYEDVLRAVTVCDRYMGERGLWVRTMKRVGAELGHRLMKRRAIDWESSYGVLLLPDHAAVLRNGLVIDGDGSVWDADTYLKNRDLAADDCELLVAAED